MAEAKGRKKLYRSGENRMIGGIMGGVGEYLGVDPVAVRAAYIIAALITGVIPLVVGYLILLFVIPKRK